MPWGDLLSYDKFVPGHDCLCLEPGWSVATLQTMSRGSCRVPVLASEASTQVLPGVSECAILHNDCSVEGDICFLQPRIL